MTGRRRFLELAGAAATLPLVAPLVRAAELLPKNETRVVVVGGGFSGAIAAKTLRLASRDVEVVLVERNRSYAALPGANWVLGGSRRIGENRVNYDRLEALYGVKVVYGEVLEVDAAARNVVLAQGTLPYDFAVVAPGIGLRTDEIEGMDAGTAALMPHAWTSGEEIGALKRRLEEMKDGGVVAVSLPPLPYRCPQAAYERIGQIAFYLKQAKPRSKILVLDASPAIPTLGNLFTTGWARAYPGMIEYRGGQRVLKVDGPRLRLTTAAETIQADVANLIPPQSAGALAHKSGLVGPDRRWCPVDHATYESTLAPGVHVIGDATLTDGLQKSASTANAQGKACALNIAAALARRAARPHVYSDVVYSLLNDKEGASSIAFYRGEGSKPQPLEKGGGDSPQWSELEGVYARAWVGAMLAEMSA